MKPHRMLSAAFALCTFIRVANAQEQRIPSVDELMQLRSLGAVALSPDGQYVAYEIQRPDMEADSYKSNLFLEETRSRRQLLMPVLEGNPGAFEWSPDGQWLAFMVYPKSGNGQIWAVPADGGPPWQLSNAPTGINAFHWAPDSTHIALLTTLPDRALNERLVKSGSFEVVGKDYQQTGLWLIDATVQGAPHVPRVLTSSPAFSIVDFTWSPDSTQIAFTAADTPLLTAYSSQDIYLLDRSKGDAVRKIIALPSVASGRKIRLGIHSAGGPTRLQWIRQLLERSSLRRTLDLEAPSDHGICSSHDKKGRGNAGTLQSVER